MNFPRNILERNMFQSKDLAILSILICILRLCILWFSRYWIQKSVYFNKEIILNNLTAIGTIETKSRCTVSRCISKCSGLQDLPIGTSFVPKYFWENSKEIGRAHV